MKVVLPYTKIEPGVEDAIRDSGFEPELVFVGARDIDYFYLLDKLWKGKKTFCVVEQDIIVSPKTLPEMRDCICSWCGAAYNYLGVQTYVGLGCTKFTTELMILQPTLMDWVAHKVYENHSAMHWCTLDAAIQTRLRSLGYREHVHTKVLHLHDRPSHGCC